MMVNAHLVLVSVSDGVFLCFFYVFHCFFSGFPPIPWFDLVWGSGMVS